MEVGAPVKLMETVMAGSVEFLERTLKLGGYSMPDNSLFSGL